MAEKPRGPQDETGDPVISPSESPDLPPIFPHQSGWSSPALHGVWVDQYGSSDPCLQCHKKISTEVEVVPTCSSCHPLYPHKSDWIQKELHGNAFLVNGRSSCATQCHGYDLNGGLSGISCNQCHTTFPHATNWIVPGEHGEAAKGSGKELCKSCHGDDLQGGSSGVSCTQCHEGYPHATNWAQADQHGAFVLDNGKTDCQTMCHGVDLQGGLSGIACDSCHDLYPHSNLWQLEHRTETPLLGTDVCKSCHGDDFSEVLNGQNCFSCHADYPHPDSASWIPFTGGHGEKIKVTYGGSLDTCDGCHGAALTEMKDGQNCFSCHPSFPHEKKSDVWETYAGHGVYTLPRDVTECELCHGSDYEVGLRGNPRCYTCHDQYPHPTGWRRDPGQPQDHGTYVVANGVSSCGTAECHGPDPLIAQGPNCSSCHDSYPHPPGWDSGLLHGPVAKASINFCKACHGAGLNTAPPGYQSCVQCHPSYLRHETAELGYPPWDTYSGHGQYVMSPPQFGNYAECEVCHGVDAPGPIATIKTCKDASCHQSFPHTQANWDQRVGHGEYIHSVLGDDLTDCKLCHGNSLTGGISGQSCYGCHGSYPHISGWYDATPGAYGGSHGSAAFGSGKDNCASAGCHGVDFSGGIVGDSCIGCHPDYPHTDPNWGAIIGDTNLHANTFITKIIGGETDACQSCHGTSYNRWTASTRCIDSGCHPSGVTHRESWGLNGVPTPVPSHGIYFSSHFNSNSTSFCQDCHGAPIAFNAAQTKANLDAESDCYVCHWAYPHTAFDNGDVYGWVPADPANFGHVMYLIFSPLIVGDIDNLIATRPGGSTSDPLWVPAIQNTCGGGLVNNCHFNGYRSEPSGSSSAMCGQACHAP